jgi:hypothetical protein
MGGIMEPLTAIGKLMDRKLDDWNTLEAQCGRDIEKYIQFREARAAYLCLSELVDVLSGKKTLR